MLLFVRMEANTGKEILSYIDSHTLSLDLPPREYERLFDTLERSDLEEVSQISGCRKPCRYRKYNLVAQYLTSFKSNHFTFSLVAISKKTIVESEQLIYPLSSLVAEFGGTLGSEWKIAKVISKRRIFGST